MEIPGFEKCEKIAESGFVSYWQAFQQSLNRNVTLVLLRPDVVANPEARRSFLRDIRVVAGLKHAALFHVYDVLELDAALVVVVEHLTGVTLRHYVRQRGAVGEAKAVTVARWVAEGLSHVYEKTGLVHMALTPDHVWIDAGGQVKILGFGFHDIFEHIGYSPAELPFLTPEQVQRQSTCDYRADFYAVGALLYYMITGRPPFEGYSSEQMLSLIVKGQLPAPMTLLKESSLPVNQLLSRLMMKDPANRYAGWLSVMQEMDKVLGGAKFLLSGKKGGLSTILLPPTGRPRVADTKEPANAAPKPAEFAPSFNFTTPAVILLVLIFWGWIGWRLWEMPPPAMPGMSAQPPAMEVTGPALRLDADERPSARVRVTRQPSARLAPSVPADRAATDFRPIHEPFDELADRVVSRLAAGELENAMLAVDMAARSADWAGEQEKLNGLRRVLDRGGDTDVLVLEGLQQRVGQTIPLQMNGRMTEATVNRIEGRNAIITEQTMSGSLSVQKHVSIPVGNLALSDQARLMATGSGPEYAVARILLYLKGGAKERALALVPQAGALGPAFKRYVEGLP